MAWRPDDGRFNLSDRWDELGERLRTNGRTYPTLHESPRPRVIVVTHHLPWPVTSGGRRREAELLTRLSVSFDIEVVAVTKVPRVDFAHMRDALDNGVRARVFPAHTASEVKGESPLVTRHRSDVARSYIAGRIASLSPLVHVEGHYLLHLIPEHMRSRALLVEHNIESTLFEQRAGESTEPERRCILLRDADLTRAAERHAWRSVGVVAAVTDQDAEAMTHAAPEARVEVLPHGTDHLNLTAPRVDDSTGDSTLTFFANFAYEPNQDAARILVYEILPEVLRRRRDVKLVLAGHSPPTWLVDIERHHPHITVTGWVDDRAALLDDAGVVVCPLRIGGGAKLKIYEALARGCAIVTTPIGAQGLGELPPDAVVKCGDNPAIVAACLDLLSSPAKRRDQQRRALAAARQLPSWDEAASRVAALWAELSNGASAPAVAEDAT
jgi:glycosyltransferase involved in cell wall biosynthesis